jgi:hypothetical protein
MSTTDDERRRYARRVAEARFGFRWHLPIYIIVNVGLVMIWLFSTGPASFPWPLFPIFFWGIGVFSHYMAAYHSSNAGWIERETDKILKEKEEQTT